MQVAMARIVDKRVGKDRQEDNNRLRSSRHTRRVKSGNVARGESNGNSKKGTIAVMSVVVEQR